MLKKWIKTYHQLIHESQENRPVALNLKKLDLSHYDDFNLMSLIISQSLVVGDKDEKIMAKELNEERVMKAYAIASKLKEDRIIAIYLGGEKKDFCQNLLCQKHTPLKHELQSNHSLWFDELTVSTHELMALSIMGCHSVKVSANEVEFIQDGQIHGAYYHDKVFIISTILELIQDIEDTELALSLYLLEKEKHLVNLILNQLHTPFIQSFASEILEKKTEPSSYRMKSSQYREWVTYEQKVVNLLENTPLSQYANLSVGLALKIYGGDANT